MKPINIITIYPNLIKSYLAVSVLNKAKLKKLMSFNVIDLRDYAVDKRGSIDGKPYGGGDGMVLRPEPLASAIKDHYQPNQKIIYTSPKGKFFNQLECEKLVTDTSPLTFICGRFAGIDERIIKNYVDVTYSLGDFVLSGGELPVLSILDSMSRSMEGVLGSSYSYQDDSFSSNFSGGLEYPLYTRPEVFEGEKVPEVLLSGNHKDIEAWKNQKISEETAKHRPDLIPNKKPKG